MAMNAGDTRDGTSGHKTIGMTGMSKTINSVPCTVFMRDGSDLIRYVECDASPATSFDGEAGFAVGCQAVDSGGGAGATNFFNEGTTTVAAFTSVPAGGATLTLADIGTTDETCYPVMGKAATGGSTGFTDTALEWDAANTELTAPTFVGALTGDVTGSGAGLTAGTVKASALQAAAADLGAANVTINLGNTNGAFNTNITTDGSITAGSFVGNVTGNADTATALATIRTIGGVSFDGTANIVPASITVADTADTTCFVGLWESATGNLEPKSDGALLYNAGTGALTATSFVGNITGDVTGNADSATLASTFTCTDNENEALACNIVFVDGAEGAQGAETDGDLTYNPSTGTVSATIFSGALSGNATTATDATTLATPRAIGGVNFDGSAAITPLQVEPVTTADAAGPWYPLLVDGLTGAQACQSDAGISFAGDTNILTCAGFAGPLTGAVTGNADTATLAATITLADAGDTAAEYFPLIADAVTGSKAALTDAAFTYNPNTDSLTIVNALVGNDCTVAGRLVTSTVTAHSVSAANEDLSAALGNVFTLTSTDGAKSVGLGGAENVTITNGTAGQRITLIAADGNFTMTDGNDMILAGAFAMTAGDTIELIFDGSDWFEVARSDNDQLNNQGA